jgi:hypothetical protein
MGNEEGFPDLEDGKRRGNKTYRTYTTYDRSYRPYLTY